MANISRVVWLAAATILLATTGAPALAQEAAVCPPSTLLALARAGSACFELTPGEVCYGSGLIGGDGALLQSGDRALLADVSGISLEPAPESLSAASLWVETVPGAENGVYLFAYGPLYLRNDAPVPIERTAFAIGATTLRALPDAAADDLEQLNVNDAVIADGRDDSGEWLHVRMPSTGLIGWAAVKGLQVDDVAALPVVHADTLTLRPFQALTVLPGAPLDACGDRLRAGVLAQSPGAVDFSHLLLNGMAVDVRGTVLLSPENDADGAPILRIEAVAGDVRLATGDDAMFVPAGAAVTLVLAADGQAQRDRASVTQSLSGDWRALPLNNLPDRVTLAPALDANGIAAAQAAYQAALAAQTAPTPERTPDMACQRTVWRDTDARTGPGDFYDAAYTLPAGTALMFVLAAEDPDGHTWWQAREGGWVSPQDVTEQGECAPPPVAEQVPPPANNHLSLETCETNNGPLRAGQRVTITFMPPAWDSYAAAVDAVRTDPGRVRLNRARLQTIVSQPILLGVTTNPLESRYVREFSAVWIAEPGTFRIIGDWLHYEPLCTVTVPINR